MNRGCKLTTTSQENAPIALRGSWSCHIIHDGRVFNEMSCFSSIDLASRGKVITMWNSGHDASSETVASQIQNVSSGAEFIAQPHL